MPYKGDPSGHDSLRSVLGSPDLFKIQGDIAFVVAWEVVTAIFVLFPPFPESALRLVFALPLVLFLPGYSLVAALFPGGDDLEPIERIALSFGLSIAIVPLVGLTLNYTPWGIRPVPVLISLLLLTGTLALVAHLRRLALPPGERFTLPIRKIAEEAARELFPPSPGRMDRMLSAILLLSIGAAVIATVYVIVIPKEGERFTEFYILGEKGIAADYPTELAPGQEYTLVIGVGNHEYTNVTYTIEILLLNISYDPVRNESTIHAGELLDRFAVTLAHNTTEERRWNFTFPGGSYNRIQFLLFREQVPDENHSIKERMGAAYRDLHLWIRVHPSGTG